MHNTKTFNDPTDPLNNKLNTSLTTTKHSLVEITFPPYFPSSLEVPASSPSDATFWSFSFPGCSRLSASSEGSVTGNEQAKFLQTYAAGLPCIGCRRLSVSWRLYRRPEWPLGPSATARIRPGMNFVRTTSRRAWVSLSSGLPAMNTCNKNNNNTDNDVTYEIEAQKINHKMKSSILN